MVDREDLKQLSYKELQDMAREQGMQYVGVRKDVLIVNLTEVIPSVEKPVETDEAEASSITGEIEVQKIHGEKRDERIDAISEQVEEYTPQEVITKASKEAKEREMMEKGEIPKITTSENIGKNFSQEEVLVPKVELKVRMVKIKPRKPIPRSVIGKLVYSGLRAGFVYKVPEEVAEIFDNGGYL